MFTASPHIERHIKCNGRQQWCSLSVKWQCIGRWRHQYNSNHSQSATSLGENDDVAVTAYMQTQTHENMLMHEAGEGNSRITGNDPEEGYRSQEHCCCPYQRRCRQLRQRLNEALGGRVPIPWKMRNWINVQTRSAKHMTGWYCLEAKRRGQDDLKLRERRNVQANQQILQDGLPVIDVLCDKHPSIIVPDLDDEDQ